MSGSGTGGGGGGGSSGGGSGRAHFRSQLGCCICGTKSSSSRFTSSQRYAEHFGACFGPQGITRSGDLCNACVLCVKRWLQRGRQPNFFVQVLDSKKGPGPKHMKEITKRARRREAKQQAAAAIASPVGKEQKSLKSSLTTTTHTPTTRSSCGNGHHCSNNGSCSRGNLHYTQTNAKPEHYLHTSSSCIRVQSNMFSQQSYVGGTTRSSAQHSQALSNGFRCSSHKNSNNNRNSNSHCYNRSLNHHNKNDTSEHICCSCTILDQKEHLSKSSNSQGATRTRAAAARQLEAASAAAACTRNTAGVLSTSLPLCDSHHHHSSSSSLVLHSENIQMTISSDSSENDPNNNYDINQQTCCSETATSASSCSSCCYFCCCSSCCAYGGGSLSCCSGSTSGFGSNSSDISLNSSVNYSRMKSNTYHNKKQQNCSNCTCHDNKTDEINKCSMDYNCSTHRSYYHHQSRRANEFRYPQLPQTGQVNINSNEGEKGASIFTNGNSGNFQHSNNTQQTSYVTSGQNNSIVNINESASPIANTNVTTTSLTTTTTTTTIPTRRYNRRVVLPPVRMTHNPEVDSLLREIMERNSQAVNFDSREMHMAVQQELRLRNRTIHTAASASGGSISSISSADGSIEATVGSSSQTSTNRAKCSHHHSSPNHEHLAKRYCSHHCYFSCD